MDFPSKPEAIVWCSVFILAAILIVVENLLTIVLFVTNQRLRKKSLFLVINMAVADLMLGADSAFVHLLGWKTRLSALVRKCEPAFFLLLYHR